MFSLLQIWKSWIFQLSGSLFSLLQIPMFALLQSWKIFNVFTVADLEDEFSNSAE